MVSGSSASKMPESPIDIQQESTSTPKEHYKALGDGKMLIGNVTCTVKKGGVPLKKSEIEDLVKLFNNTLKETTITDKEAWVVGKENVQVFHRDQIGNPTAKATRTLEFKDEEAYKEQFAKFVKTAATTDEVAQPAIAKSGQAAAAASGSPPEAPKSEEVPAEKRTPILDLSGAPDAKTLPPLPSMPQSETKPPDKLPPPPPKDAAFDAAAAKADAAKASAPPPAAAATTASPGAAGATATSAPVIEGKKNLSPPAARLETPSDGIVRAAQENANPTLKKAVSGLQSTAKEILTSSHTALQFYQYTLKALKKYNEESGDDRFHDEYHNLENLINGLTKFTESVARAIKSDTVDSGKLLEIFQSSEFETYMTHVKEFAVNAEKFRTNLETSVKRSGVTPFDIMSKYDTLNNLTIRDTYGKPFPHAAHIALLLKTAAKAAEDVFEEGSTITQSLKAAAHVAETNLKAINSQVRKNEFNQVNSILDECLMTGGKKRITTVKDIQNRTVGDGLVLKDKSFGQQDTIKPAAVNIILRMLPGAIVDKYDKSEISAILTKLKEFSEFSHIISTDPDCKELNDKIKILLKLSDAIATAYKESDKMNESKIETVLQEFEALPESIRTAPECIKLYEELKQKLPQPAFGTLTRGLLAGIDKEDTSVSVAADTTADAPAVPDFGANTRSLLAGLDNDAASDSQSTDIEVEGETAAPGESTPSTPE